MSKGKYDYDFILDEETVRKGDTSHTKILQMVSPNSSVLECGPADGVMTRYLKEKLHCTVYIIELDPVCYGSSIQYADGGVCANLEDDSWMAQFADQSFDYILYADVLEHLRDPQRVLLKMKQLLKPHGSVLLSVPNIANGDVILNLMCDRFTYTSLGLLDNTHVHFFARENLHEMIKAAGYYLAYETYTASEPFSSEQGAFIPVEQRKKLQGILACHPTCNIYQFICRLTLVETKMQSDIDILFERDFAVESTFYFDLGEGFSEENSEKVKAIPISGERVCYRLLLPAGCIAVRYDPFESQGCLLWDVAILVDGAKIDSFSVNGEKIGTIALMTNDDPQVLINLPKYSSTLCVEVSFRILGAGYLKDLTNVSEKLIQQIRMIIDKKDKELEQAKIGIESLNSQINEAAKAIDNLTGQLNGAKSEIGEKDKQIAEASTAIKGMEKQICEARRNIAEKDKQIAEASTAIKGMEKQICEARRNIAEKDKQIAEASTAIKDMEVQLNEARYFIEAKDKQIANATKTIQDQAQQIDQARRTIDDKEAQIVRAAAIIDKLN